MREPIREVTSDALSLLESESGRHLGDVLRLPLGRRSQIGRQAVVEKRDRRVVQLVDLLQGGCTGAIPRRDYGGRDVLAMRCVRWEDIDATHFCELSQHLFRVHRRQKETIDMDFF